MRYVVIGLGAISLALAAVLAAEGQGWIAAPDAAFGLGVAFMAYAGLRAERRPAAPGEAGAAAQAPLLAATPPPAGATPPQPRPAPSRAQPDPTRGSRPAV